MKKFTGVLAVLTAAVMLAGCGSKSVEIDTAALADDLLNNVSYDDELTELSEPAIANYITIEDGVEAVMYMGSGSTADEFAIFTAPDSATADTMKANVDAFLADQSESFQDYIPEECDRIDNAVVEEVGNYVILCVSADASTAQSVIDGYTK